MAMPTTLNRTLTTLLSPEQQDAVLKLHNGSILCGGVGSGKSRTALAYYITVAKARPLYVITTANKRDTGDWERESQLLRIKPAAVDSWNNIQKYVQIEGAFFIFDEQRVVGYGAWVKAFLSIVKKNSWILLSATPGDRWHDYLPVFIANGFYPNKTAFEREHVVWNHHCTYPVVDRYLGEGKLLRERNSLLVNIAYNRNTTRHVIDITCSYNVAEYNFIAKERFDPRTNTILETPSAFCLALRRIVNSSPDRILKLVELSEKHPRLIVFYNYDYERELLLDAPYSCGTVVKEHSGHAHDKVPTSERWIYLVQYASGSEAWECIETDSMVFYSANYSYRVFEQCCGRIDRRNTTFKDLYYYCLWSNAKIDQQIKSAQHKKKLFNEKAFSMLKGKQNGKQEHEQIRKTRLQSPCIEPQDPAEHDPCLCGEEGLQRIRNCGKRLERSAGAEIQKKWFPYSQVASGPRQQA